MPELKEIACAKVNLTLEVAGRRADGYHDLTSLVAFAADAADHVSLVPGPRLSLATEGPEAPTLTGDNLIVAVAEAAQAADPELTTGAFRLEKHLPVASGIGGGSADAAAALRLIAAANAMPDPETAFATLAAPLGADIPVCLGGAGRAGAVMWGIGDHVWRPQAGPLFPAAGIAAILVNPRIAVPTGDVFTALAAAPLAAPVGASPDLPAPFTAPDHLFDYLHQRTNDLEAPARRIAPVIADVLAALASLPGARIARMSGSGATCFALFDDITVARARADLIAARHPDWWVVPTLLH